MIQKTTYLHDDVVVRVFFDPRDINADRFHVEIKTYLSIEHSDEDYFVVQRLTLPNTNPTDIAAGMLSHIPYMVQNHKEILNSLSDFHKESSKSDVFKGITTILSDGKEITY